MRLHTEVYRHRKSLHWKLTLGEKSLAAPGNWTCLSGVPVRCSTNWVITQPYNDDGNNQNNNNDDDDDDDDDVDDDDKSYTTNNNNKNKNRYYSW